MLDQLPQGLALRGLLLDSLPQGPVLLGLMLESLLQGFDLPRVPPLFRLELPGQLLQGRHQLPF